MFAKDIVNFLETIAPKGAAWENDNPGLQVGNLDAKVKNIVIALNPSLEVINFSLAQEANFIITHHPLIFKPIRSISSTASNVSNIINQLIKNDISLYSSHTNLDFAKEGVSWTLARKIGLNKIDFLKGINESKFKIAVFVPKDNIDEVAEAMFTNGAGIIGNYSKCSFRSNGEGTFLGSEEANPVIGNKENFEKADEVKLEVLTDKWNLDKVISAMLKAHPYEEPAYDIYPNLIENRNFGYGAIGYLTEPMSSEKFLESISTKLNLKNFRYVPGKSNLIEKVAVCGGSGSDLCEIAYKLKADAFITADIKYHTFLDYREKMWLIDAGHYETEKIVLETLKNKIKEYLNTHNETNLNVYVFENEKEKIEFYK